MGDGEVTPKAIILDTNLPLYVDEGICFNSLQELETTGLIKHMTGLGHLIEAELPSSLKISYHDWSRQITIAPKNMKADGGFLSTGVVMLTKSGEELSRICGVEKIEGLAEFVHGKWATENEIIVVPAATPLGKPHIGQESHVKNEDSVT